MGRLQLLTVAFLICFSCTSHGQEPSPIFLPNQTIQVDNLPTLVAPTKSTSAVLATAVETVVHDPAVCCGKDSALEDGVLYAAQADPASLKDLSDKFQGHHRMSDGRGISVQARYLAQSAIRANFIIQTLVSQHAMLIEWKSHLYVLYGAVFDESRFESGVRDYAIHKLMLMDVRFSGERRDIVFNRDTDDFSAVQGLFTLTVSRE